MMLLPHICSQIAGIKAMLAAEKTARMQAWSGFKLLHVILMLIIFIAVIVTCTIVMTIITISIIM